LQNTLICCKNTTLFGWAKLPNAVYLRLVKLTQWSKTMRLPTLDTKEAANKRGAIADIIRRNELGWLTYSKAKRKDANAVRGELQKVYAATVYAPNPRDHFIAIKVAGAVPAVKTKAGLKALETQLLAEGVEIVPTNLGVIYRIPR
jgi:hypothetical protein